MFCRKSFWGKVRFVYFEREKKKVSDNWGRSISRYRFSLPIAMKAIQTPPSHTAHVKQFPLQWRNHGGTSTRWSGAFESYSHARLLWTRVFFVFASKIYKEGFGVGKVSKELFSVERTCPSQSLEFGRSYVLVVVIVGMENTPLRGGGGGTTVAVG